MGNETTKEQCPTLRARSIILSALSDTTLSLFKLISRCSCEVLAPSKKWLFQLKRIHILNSLKEHADPSESWHKPHNCNTEHLVWSQWTVASLSHSAQRRAYGGKESLPQRPVSNYLTKTVLWSRTHLEDNDIVPQSYLRKLSHAQLLGYFRHISYIAVTFHTSQPSNNESQWQSRAYHPHGLTVNDHLLASKHKTFQTTYSIRWMKPQCCIFVDSTNMLCMWGALVNMTIV